MAGIPQTQNFLAGRGQQLAIRRHLEQESTLVPQGLIGRPAIIPDLDRQIVLPLAKQRCNVVFVKEVRSTRGADRPSADKCAIQIERIARDRRNPDAAVLRLRQHGADAAPLEKAVKNRAENRDDNEHGIKNQSGENKAEISVIGAAFQADGFYFHLMLASLLRN